MGYGDPFGLVALWLCYKSEIILMIIGLVLIITFSTIAIIMHKRHKIKPVVPITCDLWNDVKQELDEKSKDLKPGESVEITTPFCTIVSTKLPSKY